MVQALFVLGFIIFAAVASYFGSAAAKKRRAEMLALAARHRLSFSPAKDTYHDEEYAHFEIFRRGHGRYARNTLTGHVPVLGDQVPLKAGDFVYKTTEGSGKNRRTVTHKFSYLIIHLPFGRTPDLLIRPEGMFDKISAVFGADDIDFESNEFSRKFFVKCADRKFAYDVCHPRMIEFLLGTDPPTMDIERGRCCLANGYKHWSPEQFEWAIGWVSEFFDQWPAYIIKDLNHTTR